MAAGDAQRTWFPERVEVLPRDWNESMSNLGLIKLRDRLDAMLQSIRSERAILTPMMTCPSCGSTGHAAAPTVSVRARILSLARFGIASTDEVRFLEKSWNRYRREERLDLHGQEAGRPTTRCSGRTRAAEPERSTAKGSP